MSCKAAGLLGSNNSIITRHCKQLKGAGTSLFGFLLLFPPAVKQQICFDL